MVTFSQTAFENVDPTVHIWDSSREQLSNYIIIKSGTGSNRPPRILSQYHHLQGMQWSTHYTNIYVGALVTKNMAKYYRGLGQDHDVHDGLDYRKYLLDYLTKYVMVTSKFNIFFMKPKGDNTGLLTKYYYASLNISILQKLLNGCSKSLDAIKEHSFTFSQFRSGNFTTLVYKSVFLCVNIIC